MGLESIVFGYIMVPNRDYIEHNRQAIAAFPFDKEYPFTNIFWLDSPAQYYFPLIGMTGSYKEIEYRWSEWLWKFSQLLSRLEAIEAHVHLHCIYGCLAWELKPKSVCERQLPPPATLVGQQWGITEAPPDDFSIDPSWGSHIVQLNQETGKAEPYRWDKFVERWTKPPMPPKRPKKWWQLWR